MGYLVGVVVFVVGMLLSIALHEVGHMVPAKRFGVRVSQYMVGFGPTLWSRTRGETEYGVKAIPLGGYVRLVGMYAPGSGEHRPGRFAEMAQDARDASAEEILPGEEHRAFYRLSAGKKVVVMLGGPFMNLLIALVLMGVLVMGVGSVQPTTTVERVVPCVPATTAGACAAGDQQSPAAAAGLEPGDRILSYAGTDVDTWSDVTAAISANGDRPAAVVIERDGARTEVTVQPQVATRTVVDAAGAPVLDDAGEPQTVTSAYVGVGPTVEKVRGDLGDTAEALWTQVTGTARIVTTLPVQVWDVGRTLVTGGERAQDSVMSIVGVGRVAGEVGSADLEGVTTGDRVVIWVSLLASLNIALFVFNLIPLLPLDGGHVVGALYEGARRQAARLRGRSPLPGPADTARMMPLAYGVFVVLIGISALLIVADLVVPVSLT